MKVLVFSKSKLFIQVTNLTCNELECSVINICSKTSLDNLLTKQEINLLIIDCDVFRPINYNVLEYVKTLSPNTYCLVVETSIHEIDKDTLIAQISKQCMLQEIYFYQQFVKLFYSNYWNESEKKILQKESTTFCNDEYKTKYDNLYTVDENGIAIINDNIEDTYEDSVILGFGDNLPTETEKENDNYIGLEPISIKILEYLKANLNKPISITNLSIHIWGEFNILRRNAIYVYIRKIRLFIGDNLDTPTKLIKCGKGFYILKQL